MQSRGGKFYGALGIALALLLVSLPSCTGDVPSQAEEKTAGDKVAIVNGTVISKADFEQEINRIRQQFSSRGMPLDDSKLSEIKTNVLENLINTELLYQTSQKKGIEAEETAIKEQWEIMKKRFPGETEFKAQLSKMNFSEASLKSQIRRGMSIRQLIDKEVAQKVTVSDQEIEGYYKSNPDEFKQPEKIHASHILIKVDPGADESKKTEARKKMEDIQAKLKKGGDFAALAKEFSQCPSASKGGDLGYFGRRQMVKPFEEAAFALKPNQVSDIVETRFGYHLIKVAGKKPGATIPYDSIKKALERNLKQEKIQKAMDLYIGKLKENAKVEKFLPQDL